MDLEQAIVAHIGQQGPVTGLELRESFDDDSLVLWQTCLRSGALITERVGTRYLRLDRRVDGYARLSPSILRAFLSYSVTGLAADPDAVATRAREMASHFETVSRNKRELALSIVRQIRQQLGSLWGDALPICFIIAGDIVYGMAHDVPRPEQSTGELVRGSDIDLVVVVADDVPDEFIAELDRAIYGQKYMTLTSPQLREEIDYVIKRMSRVREQLRFDTFKHMVACKILEEGRLLYGSEGLYTEIKGLLDEHGVPEKLDDLRKRAREFGANAETYLLHADPAQAGKESLHLFYPSEETEEFEYDAGWSHAGRGRSRRATAHLV